MSSSKTIGIIGGGQLGQMMAISAIYMGHKVIALDPATDCPASRCLLYTSPSPRDMRRSRMPSSA